jgi:HEAT repeat protein
LGLLVSFLASPAWAGHGQHETTPNYAQGCGGREPESEASLRELVRLLSGRHGVMAVGDRLRCAVQAHPALAMRLLIPLVAGSGDASLMAAKMLGEIGPDASAAVPRLIQLLRSGDSDAREMAAQALGNMGPAAAQAVPDLARLLGDPKPSVRRRAAHALAHLGPEAGSAAKPLARLIADPNDRVRNSTSYAFQELAYAGRAAVPTLLKLLDADEADVRSRAASALGHIGPFAEAARSRLEALAEDPQEHAQIRQRARGALHALSLRAAVTKHRGRGGVLLPLVVERLDSEDPEVRREVLSFVGYLGSAAVELAPRIAELSQDPDPEIRLAAVYVLGSIGASDPASVHAVERHLGDSDLKLRRAAAATLARFGAAAVDAQPALVAALADRDSGVRGSAADALLAIDPSGATLHRELDDCCLTKTRSCTTARRKSWSDGAIPSRTWCLTWRSGCTTLT